MTYRNHPVTDFSAVVDADTQFVDVRQTDEVESGTIVGTVNIPLDQLPERMNELRPECRTVLLCRSGNRSGQAAELLSAAGFVDVVNLEGGMLAYEQELRT